MTTYRLFGKAVQPHTLAIATILGVAAGVTLLRMGPKNNKRPEITETKLPTKDAKDDVNVEKFLEDFLKDNDSIEKK